MILMLQATGFSPEFNFTTAPADGQGPVQFLAIADLGYCETDMSLEWESDNRNSITTTPPGTLAALKAAVSLLVDVCVTALGVSKRQLPWVLQLMSHWK